jgi:outer membrane protein OmpA-like peptidoglycan-associated protein/LysM repeat protein
MGGMFSDNFRFVQKGSAWVANKLSDNFEDLNTNQNDGAGVFSKDKTKYYFTTCEGDHCQIHVSVKKNNKWQRAVALNPNVNIDGYPAKQPSLNAAGDTLYFVSTRPGGKGQNDIWYSVLQKDGGEENWGPAVNLAAVNTPYIDMSPCYYAPEATLFFASNGHEGFGGLDIFMARGANFEKVDNAGLPFNSNRDDFYFVLGDKYGYMSSNREGGLGHDDIYLYRITTKGNSVIAAIAKDSLGKAGFESVSVEGTLVDAKTQQPVSDVTVALQDSNNTTIKTTETNKDGNFRMDNLSADKDMKIAVADEKNAKLTKKGNYNVKNVKVKGSKQKSSSTLFENIYFDFGKADLRPEATKVLDDLFAYTNKYPEIQIELNANTDNVGDTEYNQQLSQQRGEAAKSYLTGKGLDNTRLVVNALGSSKPMVSNNNPVGRQLNRRVEFYIIGGPGYKASTMAYVVQPNKLSIDKVAKQFGMTAEELKALNNLESDELQAYKPLRVRRIGEEGVAPVTMIETSKKGLAASSVRSGSAAPDAGPLGEGEDYHLVEPKNTMFSISRTYGMTVDELMQLNGLSSNQIYVGQKLKVKSHKDLEAATDGSTYVVREGDTMYSIATKFGMKPQELKELNNLDSYMLFERMVLKVKK